MLRFAIMIHLIWNLNGVDVLHNTKSGADQKKKLKLSVVRDGDISVTIIM